MKVLLCLAAALITASAGAAEPPLKSELDGLNFLLGRWQDGTGKVADTGNASTGTSAFSSEAGGAALLRRDHTDLYDKAGKLTGGFDQIMLIYPENDTLHADYTDGTHVIHYGSATVVPGKSVTFLSVATPGFPIFRLEYALKSPGELAVTFSAAAPGTTNFSAVATGSLRRKTGS